MRKPISNAMAGSACPAITHILLILLIGGIWVQAVISCSSGDRSEILSSGDSPPSGGVVLSSSSDIPGSNPVPSSSSDVPGSSSVPSSSSAAALSSSSTAAVSSSTNANFSSSSLGNKPSTFYCVNDDTKYCYNYIDYPGDSEELCTILKGSIKNSCSYGYSCSRVSYSNNNASSGLCNDIGTNFGTRLCNDGYDQTTEFCFNDKVYGKCNNNVYNPQSYGCCNNEVYTLSSDVVCKDNVLLPGCGSKTYDHETQFCVGSTIYTKCNGKMYDTRIYECLDNSLVAPCGSVFFNPETQFCLNDVVTNRGGFGTLIYSGQTYKTVKIGGQTWMAENLNFEATDSKCYNNEQVNCNKYGRLYNWSTAMALSSSCNTKSCVSQVSAKHRGICPSGWHIPSDADWNVLMKSVNPSCSDNNSCYNAGTRLKATSGWDEHNGVDAVGFSALPGGYGDSDGSFNNAGYYGNWWSADEFNTLHAYYRYMNTEYFTRYTNFKSNLRSVRCLQD